QRKPEKVVGTSPQRDHLDLVPGRKRFAESSRITMIVVGGKHSLERSAAEPRHQTTRGKRGEDPIRNGKRRVATRQAGDTHGAAASVAVEGGGRRRQISEVLEDLPRDDQVETFYEVGDKGSRISD